MANNVLTRKFSRTTEIFLKHKLKSFIPIISNPEALQKIFAASGNSYNDILNDDNSDVTIEKLSELLQSTTTRGKFIKEIITENFDIKDIGNFIKIAYLNFENVKNNIFNAGTNNKFDEHFKGNPNPICYDIDLNDMIFSTAYQASRTKSAQPQQNSSEILENAPLINNIKSGDNPNKNNPSLSAIQVIDPNLRACLKQSEELSVFFNLINTVDMSMAMPYVNIKFLIPSTVKSSGDQRDYMIASFNNLLFGSKADSTKNDDLYTNNAMAISGDFYRDTYTYKQLRSNDNVVESTSSGSQTNNTQQTTTSVGIFEEIKVERKIVDLGIFTSPQTMVNGDENLFGDYNAFDKLDSNTANRMTPVGDKFRPFMSIESIDFDVRPSKELMSFKTATINLILYDKSRLNDVLAFVKQDLLGSFSSEILLEYGWHHILGDEDYISPNEISPIGEFINSLKNYEKYQIVNSSYSIQENGQVNISLNISMKGPIDLRGTPVPNQMLDLYIMDSQINLLIKQIANSKLINTANNNEYLKLESNHLTLLEKPTRNNLENFKKQYAEFRNAIINNVSTDAEKREIKRVSDNVLITLNKLITEVEKHSKEIETKLTEGIFDFLQSDDDPFLIEKPFAGDHNKDKTFPGKDFISLGKVLLGLLGKLTALSYKFDEIQMVFFNLNEKAIRARNINIAAIPIPLEDFKVYIGDILKFTKQISLEGLVNIILKRYVNEKAAVVYGLNDFLVLNDNSETIYKFEQEVKNQQNKNTQTTIKKKEYEASIVTEFAKQYGYMTADGDDIINGLDEYDVSFKVPQVKMTFDTLIHPSSDETLILRINFFDEHDNPFESLFDLLNNFQHKNLTNAISTISFLSTEYQKTNDGDPDKSTKLKKRFDNIIKLLQRENLIEMFDDSSNLVINLQNAKKIKINTSASNEISKNRSFNSLKTMFKELLPSITFGAPNSAALSANVSSMQDAKLSTVFMTRDEQQSAKGMTYQILEDMNMMPTRVIPSQVSAKIIGCPIINFNQMIFFDFNTGTTIDNAYIVTGIKHSIGPGKFETDLTLTLADSYARFLMSASTIKSFLQIAKNFKENQEKQNNLVTKRNLNAVQKQIETQRKIEEIKNATGRYLFRISFV